ncbi:hypothetical protein V2J09_003977 [Rumex salicifolius]
MEELQRALMECGLAVSISPERGRCLLANRDFYPGDIITRQEPFVSVPSNSIAGTRCEVCFACGSLKKCSACHVVWYCGSVCQKSDWKLHRVECKALAKLEEEKKKVLTPSIRLMVKLYLKSHLQDEKSLPTTATDNYHLVGDMVSHMSEINEKQLILYAQMASLVSVCLQWPDLKLREIAENFSKLACNAHSICDYELRPLGTGLYYVISIINHSCLPNSVLVFDGREAVVRAVQHIPKGTEVLISYIDTAGSTMMRQKALKEQYFFTCTCPRCIKLGDTEDIEESAVLEGYRCKSYQCDGFLLRDTDKNAFICQHCGLVRNKEEVQKIAHEAKLMSDKASTSLNSKNYHEACSLYKKVEKLQVKLCHPLSLSLMRTRDNLLKIFMEFNDWKQALASCRLTIPVYEKAYPGCHPVRGLQYYTCGKLEWLLGDTESAIRSYTMALDIVQNTHGRNTPFTKELRMRLGEAHTEAFYNCNNARED